MTVEQLLMVFEPVVEQEEALAPVYPKEVDQEVVDAGIAYLYRRCREIEELWRYSHYGLLEGAEKLASRLASAASLVQLRYYGCPGRCLENCKETCLETGCLKIDQPLAVKEAALGLQYERPAKP